jgi:acylphosphatase
MANQTGMSARVYGRVQGVGFRYHTRAQALKLGVYGWVRNEPDGSVSVVAEGPEAAVQGLSNWLRKGPQGSRVDTIHIEPREAQGLFRRFSVEH